MSQPITLQVHPREQQGKAVVAQMRREGVLPGVVYGYNVEGGTLVVSMDRREFERAYRRAGASTLIDLQIDGGPTTHVFVHEVRRHPVGHQLIHVDFLAVNLNLPTTADVALVLSGEAPAVKSADGMVLQMMDTLHVRALPTHLPSSITVDISGLTEIGQAIHVRDLTLASDVEVLTDADAQIVHIGAQQLQSAEDLAADAAEAEASEAESADAAEDTAGDES
jgi:large subunit ribosomal protein L25